MILVLIFFLLCLLIYEVLKYFRNEKRGWKVYKKTRHLIIYAEKINGNWCQIDVEAEIDYGTFVPLFRDETQWTEYPIWAQNRDIIINRIVEKFPLKDNVVKIGEK